MSVDVKRRSISDSLMLDDSESGVVITGITDDKVAAKSGLQPGDEIVAATIHLDHLNKYEVMNILKVLEPYDNNMKVLTKKEVSPSADLGSFGLNLGDTGEMLNLQKDVSLNAEAPAVSLNGPDGGLNAGKLLGADINVPTLNGDLPSLSVNKPSADAGAGFSLPSFGSTGLDLKGDLGGSSEPKMLNLQKDVSLNAEAPAVSLKGLDGGLNAGKLLGADINVPTLNGDLPSLSVNKPSADAGAGFSLPSFGSTGLDLKGDLDGTLDNQNVSVSSPDLKAPSSSISIETPEVKKGDAKYKAPKFTMPHFSMPKFKDPKTDVSVGNIETPDVSISSPELKAGDIDVKNADIDLKAPNADLDITGKKKWPHQNWKLPKFKGPDADLNTDLNADVNLSGPKIDGGINTPGLNVDLPKAGIDGPDVDVKAPDLNVDAPSSKFWTWKVKKPKMPRYKSDLGLDANVNAPDVDVSVPKVEGGVDLNLPQGDINGPDVDIQTPGLDAEAPKLNWFQKLKRPKLHGPKADAEVSVPKIDGDINTPDVDLSLPKADVPAVDLEAPSGKVKVRTLKKPKLLFSGPKAKSLDADIDVDAKAPELNVSAPVIDADVNAPHVDIENPSGKAKWFTLKKPKWGGAKVNGDADVSAPDFSLQAPKIDGGINGPDVNLKAPNADLEGPNVNIEAPNVEGPSGKWGWFKKPKFGTLKGTKADIDADVDIPKVDVAAPDVDLSGPKIEGGISSPDVDLNGVDINGPDVNIDSPGGRFKLPKLKLPNLKGPKVKAPEIDADIDTPGLNVETPSLGVDAPKIDANLPDVDLPGFNADLKGANVDVEAPDVNVEPPGGKFHLPKLKLPNLKGPKVKAPEIDADIDTPGLNVETPSLGVDAPKIDAKLPDVDLPGFNADLKGANVDVEAPDVKLDSPRGGFHLPKLKLPNLKGPKVKAPEIDADIDTPGLNVETPSLGVDAPKIDAKLPDVDLPGFNADLKGANVDVEAPDVKLDSPRGGFHLPKLKLPNLKGPKVKAPEIDADIDTPGLNVETPSLGVDAPKIDTKLPDVDLPGFNADLKGANVDVEAPDVKLDSPRGGFHLPKLKLPNLKGPKVKAPEIDADIDTPGLNVETPSLGVDAPKIDAKLPDVDLPAFNADLKGANVDVEAPDVKLDSPRGGFHLPKLKLPNLKGPKVNADIDTPKVDADVKGPSLPDTDVDLPEVPAPDLNTDVSGKLNSPKFKLPKLNFGGAKAPELPDAELKTPDVNYTLPTAGVSGPELDLNTDLNVKGAGLDLPSAELKGPDAKFKTPNLDLDSELGDFKSPTFKLPGLGLSDPSVKAGVKAPQVSLEGPDANVTVPSADVSVPKLEGDIGGAKVDLKAPNVDTSVEKPKFPHFRLPKFNLTGNNTKAPEVDVSPDLALKGGVSTPDVSLSGPEVDASLPKPNLGLTAGANAEVKESPKLKLKWPFKRGRKSAAGDDEVDGVEVEAGSSDTELEVPAFKFHKLPECTTDITGEIADALGLSKHDDEDKEYVVSRGIRLPIVNTLPRSGEKIDIMERLKLAKEKTPSASVSPTEAKESIDLKFAAPSLDVSATETDSSLVRGGTFKVEKPDLSGLIAPNISTSDENERLSVSLSNMLGLDIKDSDVE